MSRWKPVVASAAMLLAACGSEPTATRAPDAPRHSSSATVTIDGPTQVKPGATCTWTARVSGGTAYWYIWQNGSMGSTYTKTAGLGSFMLSVDVETGGETVSASQGVYVFQNAPDC
jgi:hypothetical protein